MLYGCAKIGALLVCLNWRLATPELAYIVGDAQPVGLIYDAEFAPPAGALAAQFAISHTLSMGAPYESALALADAAPIVMPPTPLDTPWFLLYTSGTTGRPKGVVQTHGMVFYNGLNIGQPTGLTHTDVTLNLLPFFHTGGLNLYTNPTLLFGGTAIIQRAFDPAETLRILATEATVFFGVPAVYLFMSQHPDFAGADLTRVRSWACGGAPMPLSLLETYAARGILVQQGFGMTETGPTVFLLDETDALRKIGSVGKPQLFVDVRIVDRDGRDLPQGERGELLVKGPGVTPGYWNLPAVTAQAITADGWLHTGDVALQDADGFYFIVDRWKDMYISGGENVYPAEVENVLYSHAAVKEAAVIGVPDARWGEVGRALVVLKEGATVEAAALIDLCRSRLARYKVPKSVRFVSELPRTAAGKVRKTELRAQYGSDHA